MRDRYPGGADSACTTPAAGLPGVRPISAPGCPGAGKRATPRANTAQSSAAGQDRCTGSHHLAAADPALAGGAVEVQHDAHIAGRWQRPWWVSRQKLKRLLSAGLGSLWKASAKPG
jgi:hypothetical protein